MPFLETYVKQGILLSKSICKYTNELHEYECFDLFVQAKLFSRSFRLVMKSVMCHILYTKSSHNVYSGKNDLLSVLFVTVRLEFTPSMDLKIMVPTLLYIGNMQEHLNKVNSTYQKFYQESFF